MDQASRERTTDLRARFRRALRAGDDLVRGSVTAEPTEAFARAVAIGLGGDPKWLPCHYLYDAAGSRLFEEITAQPEYYPTRSEAAILEAHATEIREITGPVHLVELGSGYSVKTEHLLAAYSGEGEALRYVPVDVSASALVEAQQSIAKAFDDVEFTGIHGTYGNAFPVFRELSPQMVVFLGSSIGNLNPSEAARFWTSVTEHLPVGDFFLLGADLVKDRAVLEAAYDDAAGVTARFTKNYFARINRELGARLDLDAIEHVAAWNPAKERIEIWARFLAEQEIRIRALDASFRIAAGEEILVEVSHKYRVPELRRELARFGLHTRRVFTDEREWFALLLLEHR